MKSFPMLASKGRVINTNFDSFNLIGEVNIQPREDLVKKKGCVIGGEGQREGDGLRANGALPMSGEAGERRRRRFLTRKTRNKTNNKMRGRETGNKEEKGRGEQKKQQQENRLAKKVAQTKTSTVGNRAEQDRNSRGERSRWR